MQNYILVTKFTRSRNFIFSYKHYKISYFILLTEIPGLETNFRATGPRPQRFKTKTGAKQPRPKPRPQKIGLETEIGLETYSPVTNENKQYFSDKTFFLP